MLDTPGPDSLKNRWKTPLSLLNLLGDFDLDPCAATDDPTRCARKGYTFADDGLSQQWEGRVWCNPPHGAYSKPWLLKCANHGNAIAIVPPRSLGAKWFQQMVKQSGCALLFLRGRVAFIDPLTGLPLKGNTADSVLLVWGEENISGVRASTIEGLLMLTDTTT